MRLAPKLRLRDGAPAGEERQGALGAMVGEKGYSMCIVCIVFDGWECVANTPATFVAGWIALVLSFHTMHMYTIFIQPCFYANINLLNIVVLFKVRIYIKVNDIYCDFIKVNPVYPSYLHLITHAAYRNQT